MGRKTFIDGSGNRQRGYIQLEASYPARYYFEGTDIDDMAFWIVKQYQGEYWGGGTGFGGRDLTFGGFPSYEAALLFKEDLIESSGGIINVTSISTYDENHRFHDDWT